MRFVLLLAFSFFAARSLAMPPLPAAETPPLMDAFLRAAGPEDLPELRKSAAAGDRMARVMLGSMLLRDSSPASVKEAIELLTQAAAQGSAEAALQLGLAHALGVGVTADSEASDRWLRAAADKGNARAQAILAAGYLEQGEHQRALKLARPAAEAGDPAAQGLLADMHVNGFGVKRDLATATTWATRAAEQGSPAAMRLLGFIACCAEPRDVPSDAARAAEWYLLALASGDTEAIAPMGRVAAQVSPAEWPATIAKAKDWATSHPSAGVSESQVARIAAVFLADVLPETPEPARQTPAADERPATNGSESGRIDELLDGMRPPANSPGVTLSWVEVGRRKGLPEEGEVNGKTVVSYHLTGAGFPAGHAYSAWLKMPGQPPQRIATGWRPDEEGHLVCAPPPAGAPKESWCTDSLDKTGFAMTAALGEPKLAAVVSEDRSIVAVAKIVPFPLAAAANDCRLALELEEPVGQGFAFEASGFPPGATVTIESRSGDEAMTLKQLASAAGSFRFTLLPAVAGRTSGTASVTAHAPTCDVTLKYVWGPPAFEWQ